MADSDTEEEEEEEVSPEVENFLYSLLHHDYNPDLPVTAHGLDICSYAAHQIDSPDPGGAAESPQEKAEPAADRDTDKGSCKKLSKRERKINRHLTSMDLSVIEKLRKQSIAGLQAMKRKCQQSSEERLEKVKVSKMEKKTFDVDRTPTPNITVLRDDSSSEEENSSSSDTTDESDSSVEPSTSSKFKEKCHGDSSLQLHVSNLSARAAAPKAEQFERGKHPWWVDAEDLLPVNQRTKRYYNSQYQGRCDACDMKGHEPDVCPLGGPICICCGKLGHRKNQCPRVICHACFQPGHEEKNCAKADKWRDIICSRCGTVGHIERNCFEKWRQFHVTVSGDGPPRRAKQRKNKLVYCSNCARRGHWCHNCRSPPVRSQLLYCPSSPFIHRYDKFNVFRDEGKKAPNSNAPPQGGKEAAERKKAPIATAPPQDEAEKISAAPKPDGGSHSEEKKAISQRRRDGDLGNLDFVPLTSKKKRRGLGNCFKSKMAAAQSRGADQSGTVAGTARRGAANEARAKTARRINKKQRRRSHGEERPVSARRARHQEMDEWLFSVADGEMLTFKKRMRLLDSVSAVLHSIDGREDVTAPRGGRRVARQQAARQRMGQTKRRKKIQI